MKLRVIISWCILAMGMAAQEQTILDRLQTEIDNASKANTQSSRESLLSIHRAIVNRYKEAHPQMASRLQDLLTTINAIADRQIFSPEAYLFRFLSKNKSRDYLEGVRIQTDSISHSVAKGNLDEEETILFLLSALERKTFQCNTRLTCLEASHVFYNSIRAEIRTRCSSCTTLIKSIDKLEQDLHHYAQQELVPTDVILSNWRQGLAQEQLQSLARTEAVEFWTHKKNEIRSGRYNRRLQYGASRGTDVQNPTTGNFIPTSIKNQIK